MPIVSIIMPVYNAERYLDCSVGSVLAQTYPDWELVCFNDASTDGSLATLMSYAASDSRVRIIDSAVNVKQGAGRNRAIREAKGEYVMLLDADDALHPSALERCMETATVRDADLVLFDHEAVPGGVRCVQGCDASQLHGDDLRLRIIQRPVPVWSAMYRRSLFADNDLWFPEGVFYEDNAVALALQLSARNPVKIDAPLYRYHIYDTSVSHRMNDYRFFHRLRSAVTLKAHLQRLGLYDRWRDEVDFVLYNQYYANTVTGCVYMFDRVPVKRLRYVKGTVGRVVPDIGHNPYYKGLPLARRLKIGIHARWPRMINLLWRIKKSIGL